ncbi:MAG: class I SAM-dependent methyltransferase [Gammaproteobacteria bacterium]|nr:class I SAM-dependent methyltransferase [Gammaproteobacteria bacterium]
MTDNVANNPSQHCWVCGSSDLDLVKKGDLPGELSEQDFRITDADYGRTGNIYRCRACGFHQCSEMLDVLQFYSDMDDPDYEATREQRALQEASLLKEIRKWRPTGRLLDVGAGAGILVEEALKLGYAAEGVEPARSLQSAAAALDLPVHLGVLPHKDAQGPYDVLTMIDVIEHVPNPVEVLKTVREALADDGIAAIVTPDRKALAARIMGWKWWHYRMAHIGYFDRQTLTLALKEAGLEPIAFQRPGWYFPASYLFERVMQYIPFARGLKAPRFMDGIVIPLNLRDSLMVLCRRA